MQCLVFRYYNISTCSFWGVYQLYYQLKYLLLYHLHHMHTPLWLRHYTILKLTVTLSANRRFQDKKYPTVKRFIAVMCCCWFAYWFFSFIYMVQLTSKLTLACKERACALQFLSSDSVQICTCTRVNFHVVYTSYILSSAQDQYFVCCTIVRSMWLILSVLHVSQSSYCTQINWHRLPEKNQGIQWNGTLTKRDKTRGHKENSNLLSIYVLLF